MNNLYVNLNGMSLPASNNCVPGDFTGQEGPEFLSFTCSLTANVPRFCHALLTRSPKHNVINIMDQSDSLWKGKEVKVQAN